MTLTLSYVLMLIMFKYYKNGNKHNALIQNAVISWYKNHHAIKLFHLKPSSESKLLPTIRPKCSTNILTSFSNMEMPSFKSKLPNIGNDQNLLQIPAVFISRGSNYSLSSPCYRKSCFQVQLTGNTMNDNGIVQYEQTVC